jgi:sarcosine oxidase subunit gamma
VASPALVAHSSLTGVTRLGRYGARGDSPPGVVLSERSGLAIAHVAARKGKAQEVSQCLAGLAGTVPADAPACVMGEGMAVVGCAPGQWFMYVEGSDRSARTARLTEALGASASIIDHASGKVVIRMTGPRSRDVLMKGCAIDLDPRVFGPGSAAVTEIAHIGCQLWQVDDKPTFDLVVNRSIAKSFWSWLTASAAEFGYEVIV